jgi:predicted nucleic acid-binding protein
VESVYFDTAVFLAIFNGEAEGPTIKALLRELKRDKVKIQTSIITIQEVSVLGFRRGNAATDNHSKVERLARIQTVSRETAMSAAKLEALMIDTASKDAAERAKENKRRKWDCFHIATAIELRCSTLFTSDPCMLALRNRLGITAMQFSQPQPRIRELFDTAKTI